MAVALNASTSDRIRDLVAFIVQPEAGEAAFNALALKLFAHQFEHNPAFQRFCRQRGKTLRTIKDWRDIPAVPITAFKDLVLSCEPPEHCDRVFMTSGTTRADIKGRHYHPGLEVYDRSMTFNFRQRFLPDLDRIRMAVLFPTEAMMPNSSLAHYLMLARRDFGTRGSDYFLGADGIETDRLIEVLTAAERNGEPFALLGASYGFVHLLDALDALGRTFALPPGSRLLDTGGFKGQSRELAPEVFYSRLSVTFGIPRSRCINMYGMTELSTQFYDDGNAIVPSIKSGPHWIRTRVVDPLTGSELEHGAQGVLAHCDLANFNSVVTILTEDSGVATETGFKLLGRAQGAAAKGCSLAVDEFLRAARS